MTTEWLRDKMTQDWEPTPIEEHIALFQRHVNDIRYGSTTALESPYDSERVKELANDIDTLIAWIQARLDEDLDERNW